jgi:CubicO group peptidase (beta-lactamase class C family)
MNLKKEIKLKYQFAITIFLTTALFYQNGIGQVKNKVSIKNSIDSIIEKTMAQTGIVGIGAAIIIDKKIVWTKGYGYADKENKKPFTTKTIMNIGSTAKNFTGVCLMKAIEENKISLDEDINMYLPFKVINPYFPNEKITLRNIASHTSSLADQYPFYDETYNYAGESNEELGSFLKNYFDPNGKYYSKENFLNNKPGTYYQYSNIPVAVAGYIVEIVTGKKLKEYGKQIIFKPLKMKDTGWDLSEINLKNHTILYDKKEDTLKTIPLYTFPTYPEGGIRTSVSDLSKYFAAILNDGTYKGIKILEKESARAMKSFQFNATNKPENMNLAKLNSGIFWTTKLGATRVGHNGSDPGVRVFMLSDLTEEIGVIMFLNTSLIDEGISFDIYESLYKYGLELRKNKTTSR